MISPCIRDELTAVAVDDELRRAPDLPLAVTGMIKDVEFAVRPNATALLSSGGLAENTAI